MKLPGADLRRRPFPPDRPFEILREGLNDLKPRDWLACGGIVPLAFP